MRKPVIVPKRSPRRRGVWIGGWIGGDDWAQQVKIRDLSELGALVECELPPPLGHELLLCFGIVEAQARVAWAGKHFAGLEFLTLLDSETIAHEVGATLRVSAPRKHSGFDVPND